MLGRRTLRAIGMIVLLTCVGCAAPSRIAQLPTSAPTPTRAPTMTLLAATPASPTATSSVTPTPTALPTAVSTPTMLPSATPTPIATACGVKHGAITRAQLRSRSMGRVESYRIYTPACYEQQTNRRYPVLYLLHGGEHNEEHWDDIGIDDAADALIAAGAIPPLLIVLPDGGQDFGSLHGSPPPFAGYIHGELIPYIDATYRTLPDRAHRALGGISYGAAWALLLAARYPDIFSAVGAHSPAIGTFNGIYPNIQALVAGKLRIYLDVGDHDALRGPTAALDAGLTKAGWPHEFHIYPGRHNEAYWHSHLANYLHFYTQDW